MSRDWGKFAEETSKMFDDAWKLDNQVNNLVCLILKHPELEERLDALEEKE